MNADALGHGHILLDERELGSASWIPTLSAQNAERMGHGAFTAEKHSLNRRRPLLSSYGGL
jgi:hypothetical protein